MTEIAMRPDGDIAPTSGAPALNGSALSPADALVQWAYAAQQAHKIATSLARTSFVPASLRGKPEDITAAILAGQEPGLQPMATLRSIDVIQGTPALRAHAMRGLVQSHGHEIELVESTPTVCRMRGRRKGADDWMPTVTWDLDRAAKLGLLGKDQWKKQPQTMLIARATGEVCRLVAADVLYAMPYNTDELDNDGLPAATAPARVSASDILGNRPAPAAIPAAEPTGEGAEQAQPDESDRITDEQVARIRELVDVLGYDGDTVAAIVSEVADRAVPALRDLSQPEALLVVAEFERLAAVRSEAPAESEPWGEPPAGAQ